MSANYTLTVTNPSVTGTPNNIVYTGVSGGNSLNLVIGNNFGFPMTIGGSSRGKYLLVQISSNIMDATGAANLVAISPWGVFSCIPPSEDDPNYSFSLLPPSSGVTIANKGSITVQLDNIQPSAATTGQVVVQYQFDNTPADDLQASASLSSLAPYDPDLPLLVGDNDALRLTTYVNGGASTNPIMVSASSSSAANNSLHLNLLFQSASQILSSDNNSSGVLVPGWDSSATPTFRIFFPYFNATDLLPASIDLTDSLEPGDNNYDPITSAWNIVDTLNPQQTSITKDNFWQIQLDPSNTAFPVWMVTPTSQNVNLFSSVESLSSAPGPFLDLYLLQIVSVIPIDPSSPETILYFQWNNFPGFNDGLLAFPLQKTELSILSFTGSLIRSNSGATLSLQWNTTGSACLLSCDSSKQGPVAQGSSAYKRSVNASQPLRSQYTLTAIGADGSTQVTQTITVVWQVNESITPTVVGDGVSVQATATQVLVLSNSSSDVRFYNPQTLQPMSVSPLSPSDGFGASAFAISPNGNSVYVVSAGGGVYGWSLESMDRIGSGANITPSCSSPFWISVSSDNTQVIVVSQLNSGTSSGANQISAFSAYNLSSSGSPTPLSDVPGSLIVGPQSGNYYVGLPEQLDVFASSLTNATGSPIALTNPFVTGISADEKAAYALFLNTKAQPSVFGLALINPSTLAVQLQLPVGLGYNPQTEHFSGMPLAALVVSLDDALLFFIGQDVNASNNGQAPYRFSVFNSQTLEELPWSPIQFGNFLPVDVALSNDGSRLYVLAQLNGSSDASLYAVDPTFS